MHFHGPGTFGGNSIWRELAAFCSAPTEPSKRAVQSNNPFGIWLPSGSCCMFKAMEGVVVFVALPPVVISFHKDESIFRFLLIKKKRRCCRKVEPCHHRTNRGKVFLRQLRVIYPGWLLVIECQDQCRVIDCLGDWQDACFIPRRQFCGRIYGGALFFALQFTRRDQPATNIACVILRYQCHDQYLGNRTVRTHQKNQESFWRFFKGIETVQTPLALLARRHALEQGPISWRLEWGLGVLRPFWRELRWF